MKLWLQSLGMVLGVIAVFAVVVGGIGLFFMWVGTQWIPLGVGLFFIFMFTVFVHESMKEEEKKQRKADKKDYKAIGEDWRL